MSETISEALYLQLKEEVEEAKSEAERAKGALDQLMTTLKNEFGCATLKEAKAELAKLEEKKDRAQEKFQRTFKDYQNKWKK